MSGTHSGARAQTIRIYLRHHNDPEGKFTPRELTCQDYTDGKGVEQKGCGGTVWRYLTYPNQKAMRFDGPPIVVEGTEVNIGDGGIVASVQTSNVHYSTCTAKRKPEAAAPGFDRLTAAEGR
jgi:hypothetical protein